MRASTWVFFSWLLFLTDFNEKALTVIALRRFFRETGFVDIQGVCDRGDRTSVACRHWYAEDTVELTKISNDLHVTAVKSIYESILPGEDSE